MSDPSIVRDAVWMLESANDFGPPEESQWHTHQGMRLTGLSSPRVNEYLHWANDVGVLVNEPSAQEYIEDNELEPETAQEVMDYAKGPGGKAFGAPQPFHIPHPHLPRHHGALPATEDALAAASTPGRLNITDSGPLRDKPVMLVYGGAFNPPHTGHVGALQDAHNMLAGAGYKVDGSIIAPTADKLLAKKQLADEHRLDLQARANVSRAAFPHEMNGAPVMVHTGPSEEVERAIGKPRRSDLANWAQRQYPNHTIINITGEDATVPGAPDQHPSLYSGEIGSHHEGVNYLTMPRDPVTGMSSSKIRAAEAAGGPIPGMTPDSERAYREELAKHRANLNPSRDPIAAARKTIRLAQAELEWQRSFTDGTWQLTAQDPSGIFQTVVTGPRVQTMYSARKAIREAMLLLGYTWGEGEYDQHITDVERRLDEMRRADTDSRAQHGIKSINRGKTVTRWGPKRRRQQNALLKDLYAQMIDHIPAEGKATMLGGLGGAGKGKLLRDPNAPFDTRGYFHIDPDEIKKEMAARGMIPSVPGLSPMEASPMVHEEASELSQRLAHRLYREKRNVLWDFTMSNDEGISDRLNDLRKSGYNEVNGVFVSSDPETARARAVYRHRAGEEDYRDGLEGSFGGRWLPQAVSDANRPSPGSPFLSRNEEVFSRFQPQFDNSISYDVRGDRPAPTSAAGWRWKDKAPAPTPPQPQQPAQQPQLQMAGGRRWPRYVS